jgi:hypothetical protein
MAVDGATPIEGVKELIAYRYPQAIASGFAIVERDRDLGIGTMTALLEKTVDLAHRARSNWNRRTAGRRPRARPSRASSPP